MQLVFTGTNYTTASSSLTTPTPWLSLSSVMLIVRMWRRCVEQMNTHAKAMWRAVPSSCQVIGEGHKPVTGNRLQVTG